MTYLKKCKFKGILRYFLGGYVPHWRTEIFAKPYLFSLIKSRVSLAKDINKPASPPFIFPPSLPTASKSYLSYPLTQLKRTYFTEERRSVVG